jgi:DUF1680 family protein
MKKIFVVLMVNLICSGIILAEEKDLHSVKVTDVKLSGEIGRRIDLTIQKNIIAMADEGVIKDTLLKPFIKLDGKRDSKLAVWDYVGLGKTMEAMVRLAAYSQNPRLTAIKDECFNIIYTNQDDDGFIGWCDGEERNKKLWVGCDSSYVLLALVTNYQYFHDERSLQPAKKLGKWLMDNASQIAYGVQQVGMPTAFARLYEVTHDEIYVNWMRDVSGLFGKKEDSVKEGEQKIYEPHVYTTLERSCGQVMFQRLVPGLTSYDTKWKMSLDCLLGQGGMLLPGTCTGIGIWGEYWNFQQKGEKFSETCATTYLIEMMHQMMQYRSGSLYGDVMERSIYNGLFAAQSPLGRKQRYHVPFTGPREYFTVDFYCCPNNFRRMVGELPELVYYQNNDGITVNLYESSQVRFKQNQTDVQLSQTTNYPSDGNVKIEVKPAQPTEFSLSLRIPRWCQKAVVTINDKDTQDVKGGQFYSIKRQWKDGDIVELNMAMKWRWVKGRMLQAGRVALMRGPVVFCFSPENIEGYKVPDPNQGKKMEDYDFQRNLVLDLKTLGEPYKDESIRPNGLAVKVRGWSTMTPICFDSDIQLTLKEFTDESGQVTYFVPKDSAGLNIVDDELIGTCVLK